MCHEALIDLCKRMVMEYYNRYVHMEDFKTITVDNVKILKFKKDHIELTNKIVLSVDIDPWLEYYIEFDNNLKILSSYVEMT